MRTHDFLMRPLLPLFSTSDPPPSSPITRYIFSLIGMDLFGGKYVGAGFESIPRANFNSFGWSMVTVFQVMTGENWNDVLYDCMRIDPWLGSIFMVALFVMGNYLVINLFLAILLSNFASSGNNKGNKVEGSERDTTAALAAPTEVTKAHVLQRKVTGLISGIANDGTGDAEALHEMRMEQALARRNTPLDVIMPESKGGVSGDVSGDGEGGGTQRDKFRVARLRAMSAQWQIPRGYLDDAQTGEASEAGSVSSAGGTSDGNSEDVIVPIDNHARPSASVIGAARRPVEPVEPTSGVTPGHVTPGHVAKEEPDAALVDLVDVTARMVDVWHGHEFIGSEAIDWMLESSLVRTRRAAVCLAIGLLTVW